jgi:hypothetical protein
LINIITELMVKDEFEPVSSPDVGSQNDKDFNNLTDTLKIKYIDLNERLWAAEDIINTSQELIAAFDGLESRQPVEKLRPHFEGLRIVLTQFNELLLADSDRRDD